MENVPCSYIEEAMEYQYLLLAPVIFAGIYWVAVTACLAIFLAKRGRSPGKENVGGVFPFVSLIKPVCGLEKGLYENLSTACMQDYPDYEIIYSVQSPSDPALEILRRIQKENPAKKIQIVVDENSVGPNGRLANIYNASLKAKGEALVFSDSDMFLEPDYLRTIVAPLAGEKVGVSCTLYKAWRAENIFERLELLSFNMDFVTSMAFAAVTGASLACPGASSAIRRGVLEKIGGLAPLGSYLVEDFELGRRAVESGFAVHFVPYVARTGVELKRFKDWWRHQVYWDQNTRAAAPIGFFFTLLIRGVPFALFYFLASGPRALEVLAAAFGVRIVTAALNALLLKDAESLKNLWLLPVRDILGFFVWFASLVKRKTFWKGRTFIIKKGMMVEEI